MRIGNLDPSRELARGGVGRGAAGRDGPAGLQHSADAGSWHRAFAGAALGRDIQDCNSTDPGRSVVISRTQLGTRSRGKPVAGERLAGDRKMRRYNLGQHTIQDAASLRAGTNATAPVVAQTASGRCRTSSSVNKFQ